MPRLPSLFTALITEHPLPLSDENAEALQEFSVPALERIVTFSQELLGDGVGHSLLEMGVERGMFAAPVSRAIAKEHVGLRQVRDEGRTLGPGEADRSLVTLVQRLFQAAARRDGSPLAWTLPQWGADGEFGNETVNGVKALQRQTHVEPADGIFDAAMLDAVLTQVDKSTAPELFPLLPPQAPSSTAMRIAAVATALTVANSEAPYRQHVDGRTYTYQWDDFAVDPPRDGWLSAPGGVRYSMGPNRAYWKCNVFGGTVLSLCELPVPTHAVGNIRHYPRAERFGARLAKKAGWRLVQHLDHRDPEDRYQPVAGETQNRQIHDLMAQMQPGDLFFVDHIGEPAEDGGHARVCVQAPTAGDTPADTPGDNDPTPKFAQAKREGAVIKGDAYSSLNDGQELQFWLLRHA